MDLPSNDTGKRCSKCGYNLTGLQEPLRCPECGTRYYEVESAAKPERSTPESRLLALNVGAVLVAVCAQIVPHPTGWIWMGGAGPDVVRICCIIPLQWLIAVWGFVILARHPRRGTNRRWLLVGTVIPFLLAIPTCLSVK